MNISKIIISKVNKAPQKPGVYIFFNKKREVIYVGKAIKLKSRLKSYIDKNILSIQPKTCKMVSIATNIKYFLVNTELEALVLESNLIKKYRPKYNINLKDDKNYKYIEIKKSTPSKLKGIAIDGSYKISTSRKKEGVASYFGPYPQGKAINLVLRDLRKLFPYRNCNETKFKRYAKLGRPCLYGHIGLCPSPCQGLLQTKINNSNIDIIKKILSGKYLSILKNMRNDMKSLSKGLKYEEAALLRDKLNYYEYLSQKYLSSEELLENIKDLNGDTRGIDSLINILAYYFLDLKKLLIQKNYNKSVLPNFRIEFYDISNLGESIIVGSMITLIGGDYSKKFYRKFKIKKQSVQNDFKAMSEMLERRMDYINSWGKPDLIVIDGGKGQLSSVLTPIKRFGIPVISLAKKQETIFLKKDEKYVKIELPLSDLGLKALIKGRDEVHRFGVGYNRKLRKINRKADFY